MVLASGEPNAAIEHIEFRHPSCLLLPGSHQISFSKKSHVGRSKCVESSLGWTFFWILLQVIPLGPMQMARAPESLRAWGVGGCVCVCT